MINKFFSFGKLKVQMFVFPWKHLQINLGTELAMRLSLIFGFPLELPNRKSGAKEYGDFSQVFTRFGCGPFAITFWGKQEKIKN